MVAVVVPVYKQILSEMEIISYQQLLKILGQFDIVIIAPNGLNLPLEMKENNINVEYFDTEYFRSVHSYSCLMLSEGFYQRFLKYQYILIYQLDAFVFKNELLHFCSLGYDYIGAPWLSGFCEYTNLKRKILYVGNGGFSLRRVEACLNVLCRHQKLRRIYQERNEDAFFSACGDEIFRVAPKKIALTFSFEREVKACFKENDNKLPFGCHAFERYNLEFWEKYIKDAGYDLSKKNILEGAEDLQNCGEYLWMRRNCRLMESDDLFYGIPQKIKGLFTESKVGNLYLWGAGYVGRYAGDLFRDLGIGIKGFVDTDSQKQGRDVDGVMIHSPEAIKKMDRIVITVDGKYYAEIEKKLIELGFTYLRHYIFFEDILPEG